VIFVVILPAYAFNFFLPPRRQEQRQVRQEYLLQKYPEYYSLFAPSVLRLSVLCG